ncbi:DNA-binding protein [Streptomyces olivochromogenes]|uniref:DNA-binding protein n=1 Tax=Streptomyces olivochromogenes TaxID=1963 RepID=UPI001F365A85|nr:DNA-binding protein [Streptomyces olivochromogenes]MCF3136870.1 DNA-binding protein [Streptomyces olivochromogenes]
MNDEGLGAEIGLRLRRLAEGGVSRDEVADWAMSLMESDAPELLDDRLWTALDRLSGADLMVAAGQYLHGPEDFESWLAEFDASGGKL